MIDIELLEAYICTRYIVYSAKEDIVIRIGNRHPTVDVLVHDFPRREWAFITAYNPGSVILSKKENEERQNSLKKTVIDSGLSFIEGVGISDDGTWEDLSIFIPGISLTGAKALGRQFGQNAIVYGMVGGKAELVECS